MGHIVKGVILLGFLLSQQHKLEDGKQHNAHTKKEPQNPVSARAANLNLSELILSRSEFSTDKPKGILRAALLREKSPGSSEQSQHYVNHCQSTASNKQAKNNIQEF